MALIIPNTSVSHQQRINTTRDYSPPVHAHGTYKKPTSRTNPKATPLREQSGIIARANRKAIH